MDSLSLLQRSFLTQGWNPGLSHCRQILYKLTHREAQRVSESQANVSELRHSSDSSLLQINGQTLTLFQSAQETPVYNAQGIRSGDCKYTICARLHACSVAPVVSDSLRPYGL